MTKKYQITCTETQLHIIAKACELLGRVQYNQGYYIADEIPLLDYTQKFDLENDLQELLNKYPVDKRYSTERAIRCDIAFDIWRKISRNNDFTMGTEPTITIKELENTYD